MDEDVARATFRTVELTLHDRQRIVIISDNFLEQYEDWTPILPPEGHGLTHIEAKIVPTDDPNVVDVQARYV